MIDKLRKKIFWIIQVSLSIIILGIIVLYTTSSYKNTIASSIGFMDRIEVKEDIKIDKPNDFNGTKAFINPFLADIEGVYKLQIKDNSIIRESDDVTDEVRNYALKLSNKNSEEGYIGNYIYKIRKFGNNEQEITLMENEETIGRLKNTIISACIIGFIGIVITYIIMGLLTFNAPRNDLFFDTKDEKYGINDYLIKE